MAGWARLSIWHPRVVGLPQMSSRNEWENMNRPRNALPPRAAQRPSLAGLKAPLVNQHSQEYHAPSVFTSHVADILKTSVFYHVGPQTALRRDIHEGNLSFHWSEHPPHFDTCIGFGGILRFASAPAAPLPLTTPSRLAWCCPPPAAKASPANIRKKALSSPSSRSMTPAELR